MCSQEYYEPCYANPIPYVFNGQGGGGGDYSLTQNSNLDYGNYEKTYPSTCPSSCCQHFNGQQDVEVIMCPNMYRGDGISSADGNFSMCPSTVCTEYTNWAPSYDCPTTNSSIFQSMNDSACNRSLYFEPKRNSCTKREAVPETTELLPAIRKERERSSSEDGPVISPSEYSCFLPQIKKTYTKLAERHSQIISKSVHLKRLARPRCVEPKFKPQCVCEKVQKKCKKSKIPIIHCEKPMRRRLEQLAYPRFRALRELTSEEAFKSFSDSRKEIVNRSMRKSMLSLYSKLSKVKVPEKQEKKKWTEAEWQEFREKIAKLAKPKYTVKKINTKKTRRSGKSGKSKQTPAEETRNSYSRSSSSFQSKNSQSERIDELSKPKKLMMETKAQWTLTEALRNYKPSERVIKLAQPKIYENSEEPYEIKSVNSAALRYKASPRIVELAVPQNKNRWERSQKEIYTVSRNALYAKASPRTLELATPRNRSDNTVRRSPFTVTKKALKAKITPRLRELAQPKNV